MDIAALARDAWRAGGDSPRALVGLAGPPGAGKSTLARALVAEAERQHGPGSAAYLPLDGFHLSNDQLARLGLTARKGSEPSFDVRGYVALLARVRAQTPYDIYVPDYDRTLNEPVAARHLVPAGAGLVVTEGNYLVCDLPGWREAAGLLAARWYVDAPARLRRERLVRRQRDGGRSETAALDWVATNDWPNTELVERYRDRCERFIATP